MFEDEIELEKRSSSVVPLLLIIALIVSILGVAGYYVWESRKVLTSEEATQLVTRVMKAQGPATIHFHVGNVPVSVDEKPRDPHYRLLEKAGLIKVGKDQGRITPVLLTSAGEKLLSEIPGVQKAKDKDNTDVYVVPVADRKLVDVPKVTMQGPTHARVTYAWRWEPNQVGELFEASGSLVKSFNTWDRGALIQKYGANFYHGGPTQTSLPLLKGDKGWQIAPE
jgi:hypothetical protein